MEAQRKLIGLVLFILASGALAQGPVDLFSDSVELADGYLRIGAWNLRHINLESGARDILPGDNDDEDFTSLIRTFAKAIDDLDLDILAAVEVQPRQGEPNRLAQIRNRLNTNAGSTVWQSTQTDISYDPPVHQYGGLQLGLLWKTSAVDVNVAGARLLTELRQPRDSQGNLTRRTMRIPWLVPIESDELECDLLIVHLKSGGSSPQAQEVAVLTQWIQDRFSADPSDHLILLGDWNIRPDRNQGRRRLEQLQVPTPNGNRMRILTVEHMKPTLQGWQTLGIFNALHPVADLVPFTHFNDRPQHHTIDNMLDHIAISRSMDEIFDNPILVQLAGGGNDLRPGIEIPKPMRVEQNFVAITDHLPVILTLRNSGISPTPQPPQSLVRIVAAIPNPAGSDNTHEQVSIRNFGAATVSLTGWRIGDSTASGFWVLNASQYNDPASIVPGQTATIIRQGRNMALNNDGDTIRLIDQQGNVVNMRMYDSAASGQIITFE